jgi:hypothetical protein
MLIVVFVLHSCIDTENLGNTNRKMLKLPPTKCIATSKLKRGIEMQEQHFFSLLSAVTQNYHFYLETINKFYPVASMYRKN